VFSILAILAIYALYWFAFGHSPRDSPKESPKKEGFTTVPIKWLDPTAKKLPFGYYQIDDNTMAQIPYGYIIDPTDPKKVVPKSQTSTLETKPVPIKYTSDSGYLPDGYYKFSDSTMALLPLSPPNLKPNITAVTFQNVMTETNVPASRITNKTRTGPLQVRDTVTVDNQYEASITSVNQNGTYNINYSANSYGRTRYTYANGYVSETGYYDAKYDWDNRNPLPPKMYYTDRDRNKISFLPYGKDASNCATCYGYVDNTNLILKPTDSKGQSYSQYKDMQNNLDITFHPSPEDLKKQTGNDYGEATVVDQCGNKVVLPRLKLQGETTYYQPGAYRFGPANYVPAYEDSVYLSRTTREPTTAPYKSAFLKAGVCDTLQNSPDKMEDMCNATDVNACGSMSCCVLLGGSKCVAGSEKGPLIKSNYSDLMLKNKDYYYHRGKCYGNCP
jgi:hypothetical protein